MQLIADRFAVDDRGHALDLATGTRVSLAVCAAGGSTEQRAWAERCAWFSRFVHPSLACLVDYGAFGAGDRFEAWRAEPGWHGSQIAAEQVVARASRTLRAQGRSGLATGRVELGCCGGRPVVIPDGTAGYALERAPCEREIERDALGVERSIDPRLVPAIDLFESSPAGRLVSLAVWSPDGGGTGAAVRSLARAARMAGCVPVSAHLFGRRVRELLDGRTLVLFATGDTASGWRALIEASLNTSKPHLVIFSGVQPVRRVHTISLERASPEALIASVSPAIGAQRHLRHVSAAARRAQGLRDRFEQLLFGVARSERIAPGSGGLESGEVRVRVAEQLADPAEEEAALRVDAPDRLAQSTRWPAPGELARLRRLVETTRGMMRAGRHQAGERHARQLMHGFARRGEWASAVESALLLVRSLTRRGRAADAERAIESARPWATQAHDLHELHDIALEQGVLWIEQGRLPDAEHLLEASVVSALSAETGRAFELTLALARCLRLQGRWTDAWHRLAFVQASAERTPKQAVRFWAARSRVWLGRGRPAEAVADAARARDAALPLEDPELCGTALYACALAQLAAGDGAQADAAAQSALAHARQAHDGMLAVRVRLLRAEIARRQGNREPALLLVRRLCGVRPPALPFTIRARAELLKDLLMAADPAEAAERRADALGLPALRLFAPAAALRGAAGSPAADDIVELLRCCQSADEDGAVLVSVCARLRARLGASGAAFYGIDADRDEVTAVAADGSRVDPSTARRVTAANQLVLPHHGADRIEGGIPVRYAGRTVGALVVVWSTGANWNDADVSVLLSTGATAAGPALSGVMTRRCAQRQSASELLGSSAAIARVRAAIERAAGAPFPVLIEGESGAGKELVARSLHRLGTRRDRPFCTLNCAALPDDLVESELFGHARGAFTGAVGERRGVFEDAHTGTLFLDEIGELSPRAQAKLLRVIQEGEIRRVGENIHRRVDVRLITATNRDLQAEAASGRFRSDLLYRLDVIRIGLPPLRDRIEDIPLLAEHFWREATERIGSRATLSALAVAALARYPWPGNIRELQNVLASLAVRCPRRGIVSASALPPQFSSREVSASFTLDAARRTFDRSFIRAALVRAGGHRSRAAEELGVSRQGLAKLLARLEIEEGSTP